MMTDRMCHVCGSSNLIDGPFYDRDAYTCIDCGNTNTTGIMEPPAPKPLPDVPSEGFTSLEEMQEHLRKLQRSSKGLLIEKTKGKSSSKTKSVTPATPVGDHAVPDDLVMFVNHRYTRRDESWNIVLKDARNELSYRNENVLVIAHDHIFNQECTSKCREVGRQNES